MKKISLQTPFN